MRTFFAFFTISFFIFIFNLEDISIGNILAVAAASLILGLILKFITALIMKIIKVNN